MCKVPSWRLEPRLLPSHPTNIYTYRMTITLRIYNDKCKVHNGKQLAHSKESLNKSTDHKPVKSMGRVSM